MMYENKIQKWMFYKRLKKSNIHVEQNMMQVKYGQQTLNNCCDNQFEKKNLSFKFGLPTMT